MKEYKYCENCYTKNITTIQECSVCGWSIEEYVGDYAYCPNCGAKMDGGDGNDDAE